MTQSIRTSAPMRLTAARSVTQRVAESAHEAGLIDEAQLARMIDGTVSQRDIAAARDLVENVVPRFARSFGGSAGEVLGLLCLRGRAQDLLAALEQQLGCQPRWRSLVEGVMDALRGRRREP